VQTGYITDVDVIQKRTWRITYRCLFPNSLGILEKNTILAKQISPIVSWYCISSPTCTIICITICSLQLPDTPTAPNVVCCHRQCKDLLPTKPKQGLSSASAKHPSKIKTSAHIFCSRRVNLNHMGQLIYRK
jgi:hypothetical protein